jgi:hypothetical protein
LSACSLGQQLSESCCHHQLALVHIMGAFAVFPLEVRSLSISYPLSSSQQVALKDSAHKITKYHE